MNKSLGAVLFGLGRIGTIHLRNMLTDPRLIIYYVIDENIDLARSKIDSLGSRKDIKVLLPDAGGEVYMDQRIDVVFICAPTRTHFKLIKKSIEQGKHVFCEKPISDDEKEINELYVLARKRNVLLFCSFNRRFDPAIAKLYQTVRSETIGKVLTIKTCSRDHPLPETCYLSISNGIFHDCAVHDIDVVCWIYGQLPTSVYVVASTSLEVIRDLGDVDSALIVMKFPRDGLACIDISRISNYGYDQRVEVHGLNGMLVSENRSEHGLISYGSNGIQATTLENSFNDRYRMSYINALDHFLSVAQEFSPDNKQNLSVKARDAVSACMIAEACKRSLMEGRPIAMSWDDIVDY